LATTRNSAASRWVCSGGDHRAGQVQVGQQRLKAGDLAWRAVDLALGNHRTGGVVHRGEQVDLPAITTGAAQGLAVDRDRTSTPVGPGAAAGQPGADGGGQRLGVQAGQGAADGGLCRHRPAVGGVASGAERGTDRLRGIGGPFADRSQRARAGQDCGGGHGQDRYQWVAAATGASRVVDGGQVAKQVRGFGWLQGIGVGQLGEGRWDGGGWVGRHGRPSRS
jgi:hypothetical protein